MPKTRLPSGPSRISPSDALPDVVERLVPRGRFRMDLRDVLVFREAVSTRARSPARWRYLVFQRSGSHKEYLFASLQRAVSKAEQIAAERQGRVVYIEDDSPTVFGDYRPDRAAPAGLGPPSGALPHAPRK